MALNLLHEWKKNQPVNIDKSRRTQQPRKRWNKPPEDWVKINVDATCQAQGSIGLGCVVRDARGEFIRARSVKGEKCHPG